jgi:xanthine dehydrogenase YagT iron-sulfur-binding subunit
MESGQKKKKIKAVSRRVFLQTLGGGAAGVSVASRILGKDPRPMPEGPGELEMFTGKTISLTVNGKKRKIPAAADDTLLFILRERLRLTGSKSVCNRGECGGCTVLLNGKPIYACHMLALQADGAEITTVEGLAAGGKLHPVQQAFIDKDAYQCGFCTPGFIMTSVALLNKTSRPSPDEIRAALSGNLCRCGNFQKIFAAVAEAAATMRRG